MRATNRDFSSFIGASVTGMALIPEAGLSFRHDTAALPPHRNPGYELTFLLAGQVAWTVQDGPVLRLSGGDLAVTQPEVVHAGEFDIIQPCRLLWLVVNPLADGAATGTPFTATDLVGLNQLFRAAGNRSMRALPGLRGLHVELEKAARNLHAGDETDRAWQTHHVRLLLLRTLLLVAASLRQHDLKPRPASVEQALAFLRANLARSPGITAIAAAAGVSVSRLNELFKIHVGQTPVDCANRMRIQAARELLAGSALSVTEIAFRLGYSSSQYFAHSFQRHTGTTPSTHRRAVGTKHIHR